MFLTWLQKRPYFRVMDRTFKLSEINTVAKEFWQSHGETATVFAFYGQMGSGKTTFIHALCEAKKVKDIISSPTYPIINEYGYDENGQERMIYHIDMYRLKDEAEAIEAGIEDCIYSDHICLVEWPEKAPGLFPDETLKIYVEMIDAETRRIRVERL